MAGNFYADSSFFQRLTKRGNEHHWNEFIDECEAHKIEIPQGCDPMFTSFLLLERIGLGGVLIPIQKSPAYKALVIFVRSYMAQIPDPRKLSEGDQKSLQEEIASLLDGMGETFHALLYLRPELQSAALLKNLDKEIHEYATSRVAGELVKPTLLRIRQFLVENPERAAAAIVGHLGWNLMTTFPYIEPDQVSPSEAEVMFEKAKLWFDSLFATLHASFVRKRQLGFFRLAEARAYAYAKIIAKDSQNPKFASAKKSLKHYRPMRRQDDLCDGELIDFAVLGFEGKKVTCFTADNPIDIKNRLSLLKGTLTDVARDVQGWIIQPCWGRVYCTTQQGQPLQIMESFILDSTS